MWVTPLGEDTEARSLNMLLYDNTIYCHTFNVYN